MNSEFEVTQCFDVQRMTDGRVLRYVWEVEDLFETAHETYLPLKCCLL